MSIRPELLSLKLCFGLVIFCSALQAQNLDSIPASPSQQGEVLPFRLGNDVRGWKDQVYFLKSRYKATAPNRPIYAEGKSFVMPASDTGPNEVFYNAIKPWLSKSLGRRNKSLLKDSGMIGSWVFLERVLKQNDTIRRDNIFWSYVVDSKKKQVIGLNMRLGEKSVFYVKLKYGSLPFRKDLPETITEFIEKYPNIEFWYELNSPCASYNAGREKVIMENIKLKSLKGFHYDTASYTCHLFFKRDQFYFQKPFETLLKDIDLKVEDYRMFKMAGNTIWGVLLKFSRNNAVFVRLMNTEASDDPNLPLHKIKGDILTIEQIDTKQQVTRIARNLKRGGIYFSRYAEVVNLVYMF